MLAKTLPQNLPEGCLQFPGFSPSPRASGARVTPRVCGQFWTKTPGSPSKSCEMLEKRSWAMTRTCLWRPLNSLRSLRRLNEFFAVPKVSKIPRGRPTGIHWAIKCCHAIPRNFPTGCRATFGTVTISPRAFRSTTHPNDMRALLGGHA